MLTRSLRPEVEEACGRKMHLDLSPIAPIRHKRQTNITPLFMCRWRRARTKPEKQRPTTTTTTTMATRVVSWVCSGLVLCCSCACVPAICSYLCRSLSLHPSPSVLSGEIRVKVTAAFLAGKCENSQNENQMQTPQPAKGNRQPATAQKKSHLAREVDAWGLCPCLSLSLCYCSSSASAK